MRKIINIVLINIVMQLYVSGCAVDKGIPSKNNEDAITLYNTGIDFAKENLNDKAIAQFSRALAIDTNFSEAYFNRGILYMHMNQYDQATNDFNKALEINPKKAEAYKARGISYANKNQWDKAINDYNKYIDFIQNDCQVYFNRAVAYNNNHMYLNGINDLNTAISINHTFAEAYDFRGYINITLYQITMINQYKEKACADFNRACDLGECDNFLFAKRNSYCK